MELRIFSDRRCLGHEVPWGFPESPARLQAVLAEIERRSWPIEQGSEPPSVDVAAAVEAVHGREYVERFRRASERGDGLLGSSDNPLSAGTWEAAWAAAGSACRAVGWVAEESDRHALVAVRPPGHHAERHLAMGFCYFNNVAVAVESLRLAGAAARLAVFDFDVHHGNGTQEIFYSDPDVLYVSVHQFPFYPGTGSAGEVGEGPGAGATLNVPLPAGSGDEEYASVMGADVLPALRHFRPELLLVSAGFDAWRGDPLGGMTVSAEAFSDWGRRLAEVARECCSGRMVSLLEGGYDLQALPGLVADYAQAVAAAR